MVGKGPVDILLGDDPQVDEKLPHPPAGLFLRVERPAHVGLGDHLGPEQDLGQRSFSDQFVNPVLLPSVKPFALT